MKLLVTIACLFFTTFCSGQDLRTGFRFIPDSVARRDKKTGFPAEYWGERVTTTDFISRIDVRQNKLIMYMQGKPNEFSFLQSSVDSAYSPIGITVFNMGTRLDRDGDFSAHLIRMDDIAGKKYEFVLNFREYQYQFTGRVVPLKQ